jgi:hypothetical protein
MGGVVISKFDVSAGYNRTYENGVESGFPPHLHPNLAIFRRFAATFWLTFRLRLPFWQFSLKMRRP